MQWFTKGINYRSCQVRMHYVLLHITTWKTISPSTLTAEFGKKTETNKVKNKMLFNETRQYNIHIVHKYIFLKYETRQIKYTEKIIKLHLNCNGSLFKL